MPPLRPLTLALAGLLLLLPSGCGGDDSPAATPSAATRTGPIEPAAFIADLLRAIDREDSVHLQVEAPLLGSGDVDVAYGGKGGSRILVHADMLEGPSTFVISGNTVYVEQPDGGQWTVVDKDDPSYGTLLDAFGTIGPHESVAGLGDGIESVTRAGSMVVGGVATDRYRVTANPSRASGAFRALAGTSNIAEAMTFDFYVDGKGLPRQVETQVNGDQVVVTLSRWGSKVDIHVPSGEELVVP